MNRYNRNSLLYLLAIFGANIMIPIMAAAFGFGGELAMLLLFGWLLIMIALRENRLFKRMHGRMQ